jgi:signal transduction histidine kinase
MNSWLGKIESFIKLNEAMEKDMKTNFLIKSGVAAAGAILILAAGCAPVSEKAEADMKDPVNCKTAQGDLRVLKAEKANLAKEIGEGVSAIFPIGLVAHLIEGNEGETMEVATGEYDKMLDKKIAEIKTQCNIE